MASTISCPRAARMAQVIVVGTDPNALGANGLPVVPFWEDVTVVAGSRIFGMTCNLPGDPSTSHNCRNDLNSTRYQVDALRFVGGFEGKLFGSDTWRYTTSYVYAINGEDDTHLRQRVLDAEPARRASPASAARAASRRRTIRCSPARSARAPATASSSTSSAPR